MHCMHMFMDILVYFTSQKRLKHHSSYCTLPLGPSKQAFLYSITCHLFALHMVYLSFLFRKIKRSAQQLFAVRMCDRQLIAKT